MLLLWRMYWAHHNKQPKTIRWRIALPLKNSTVFLCSCQQKQHGYKCLFNIKKNVVKKIIKLDVMSIRLPFLFLWHYCICICVSIACSLWHVLEKFIHYLVLENFADDNIVCVINIHACFCLVLHHCEARSKISHHQTWSVMWKSLESYHLVAFSNRNEMIIFF